MSPALLALPAAAAVVFTVLLFARALVHKLADVTAFSGFVADYGLIPERHAKAAANAVVAVEAVVVLALVLPATRPAGAILAALVLLGYAAAIAHAVASGRRFIECGCGGAVQPVSPALVVRNGVLAAIALLGAAGAASALSLGEAAAAVTGGFILFVGYLLADQILGNAAYLKRRA